MWIRFNPRRTANENGAELFRDQILNRIVSHTQAPGLPHYALIDHLAADAEAPVTIERVSEELFGYVSLTGRTYFGFLGSILDRMVENYDGLEWWVSDKGLNIGPPLMTPLSEFDRLAGELMLEARTGQEKKYLSHAEYERIAMELDETGLRLLDSLSGRPHSCLAAWNQKNPGKAVKTFRKALQKTQPKGLKDLPRAVKRRLYRAAEIVQKSR
jgi:hypothetical protein